MLTYKRAVCTLLLGCLVYMSVYGDIGSDTVVSRQPLIIFSGATNNTVLGFAALAGGFFLSDSSTSFSFNSYFPVGVTAGFNGGTCYLMRDMPLDSYTEIETSGTIVGNFHTLSFAPRTEVLSFPSAGQFQRFDRKSTGTTVYSVDWTQTDTYLLAGTALSATYSELQIFVWDSTNSTITVTAGLNQSVGMNEVAWQPVAEPPYYFAAATTDGVRTYSFNPSASTIVALDVKATSSAAAAVAWAPTGTYLAISINDTVASDRLYVYSFLDGLLTQITVTNNLPPSRYMSRSALAWDNTGRYLAVGCDLNLGSVPPNNTLFLFSYNGATLSLVQSIRFSPTTSTTRGSRVGTLAWSHDGQLLAVGLANSSGEPVSPTNKIRMFSFNPALAPNYLTEQTSYRNGETLNIYNIAWDTDDSNLAYVRGTGANFELRGCIVNRSIQKLVLWAQGTLGGNGLGVAWNHIEDVEEHTEIRIAAGDDATYASVWGVGPKPFVLQDLDLVFDGPVQLKESMIINGICSVTSNNNTIDVNNNSIILSPGAQLTVYNAMLDGMGGGQSVVFLDNTSTITLSQVQITNTRDFYLHGSLTIFGEVLITGTYKFTYSTDSISRIRENSVLCFDSGITFSYDPPSGANNLFVFESSSSELFLNEVSSYIASSNGLSLTNGKLTINGRCSLTAPHGLYLGNGIAANNINLNVLSDSGMVINSGYLINKFAY